MILVCALPIYLAEFIIEFKIPTISIFWHPNCLIILSYIANRKVNWN